MITRDMQKFAGVVGGAVVCRVRVSRCTRILLEQSDEHVRPLLDGRAGTGSIVMDLELAKLRKLLRRHDCYGSVERPAAYYGWERLIEILEYYPCCASQGGGAAASAGTADHCRRSVMSDCRYDDRHLAERGLTQVEGSGGEGRADHPFIEWQRRILRADYKMPVPDRFEVYAPAGKIDDLNGRGRAVKRALDLFCGGGGAAWGMMASRLRRDRCGLINPRNRVN